MLSIKEQEFNFFTAEEGRFTFDAEQNYWGFPNMLIDVIDYYYLSTSKSNNVGICLHKYRT
jgi:hypothetical protein